MSTAPLEAANLRVSVPGRLLVDGFDCSVHPGEFVAVLGGNGTGKSLLMRTLAGLRAPDGGQVRMPLNKTFFSPAFGMLADKFGVGWMIIVPQPMH